MIFGARFIIYLTFLLLFIFAFKGGIKEKKALILATLSIPILVLIIKSIHLLYFEPRPFVSLQFDPLIDVEEDASFPSRHAAIMSSIAFAYLYFKSKWAVFLLLLMLYVGISRIYVGVHYPLDILGGFIVGITSLAIALQVKKLLKHSLL